MTERGALLLLCMASTALAAEVRLESHAGVDTNVARVETQSLAPTTDNMLQAVLDVADRFRPHRRVLFDASYQAGAKRFFEQSGEDTLLQNLGARLTWAPEKWLALALRGRVKDRTTRDPAQPLDRARLSARPEVQLRGFGGVASLAGVAERQVFKPNHDLDADGFGGDLTLSRRFGAFGASLTGSVRARDFEGDRWVRRGEEDGVVLLAPQVGEARVDDARFLRAGLRYGGAWIARVGYTYGVNDSNHDPARYSLHSLEAAVTVPLPLGLVGSARLYILSIDHELGVDVASRENEVVSFDSDARSSLTVRLERPVGDHFAVVARGSTWSLPTSGPDYRRELATLGLSYTP